MRTVELLHVCGLKRVFSLAGCNPMFLLELELEEITLRRYHRCPLFDVRFVNQEGKLGSKSIYLLISRLAILSKLVQDKLDELVRALFLKFYDHWNFYSNSDLTSK